MQKPIKSIINTYNKLSNVGKLFIFTCIFLILTVFFKNIESALPCNQEGFTSQNDKIVIKNNDDLYDDFYVSIYDSLLQTDNKVDYEVDEILKLISNPGKSKVLDIGCGTGKHLLKLHDNNINVTGVDISESMVKEVKKRNPKLNCKQGNAMNPHLFKFNQFTHIICMYFTVYYIQNKKFFFDNCIDWLLPGGFLIVHLVDRETFDPILPPGNPLHIVSPQKYAKQRITNTNINFDNFNYKCDFKLDNDTANFEEKIKFKNGKTRINNHKLYMEDTDKILSYAQQSGFNIYSIIDLMKIGYDNQFVYVFTKPG